VPTFIPASLMPVAVLCTFPGRSPKSYIPVAAVHRKA
jgi:hypothetical protein